MTNRLLLMSIVYCCSILLYFIGTNASQLNEMSSEVELDMNRNEQSTPRSFILPATPAVAEEQERKLQNPNNNFYTDWCLLKLHDSGYEIDEFSSSFNAKYIEALIEFQKNNSLPITGQADSKTRKLLGC